MKAFIKTFWDNTKKSENKNCVNFYFNATFWNALCGKVKVSRDKYMTVLIERNFSMLDKSASKIQYKEKDHVLSIKEKRQSMKKSQRQTSFHGKEDVNTA